MNPTPLLLTISLCFIFTVTVYFLCSRFSLAARPTPVSPRGNDLPFTPDARVNTGPLSTP